MNSVDGVGLQCCGFVAQVMGLWTAKSSSRLQLDIATQQQQQLEEKAVPSREGFL